LAQTQVALEVVEAGGHLLVTTFTHLARVQLAREIPVVLGSLRHILEEVVEAQPLPGGMHPMRMRAMVVTAGPGQLWVLPRRIVVVVVGLFVGPGIRAEVLVVVGVAMAMVLAQTQPTMGQEEALAEVTALRVWAVMGFRVLFWLK